MDTKKLRQKILDLAIHGKLVPQDPNDEPASVLLERIKAEKEQLIKDGKIKRQKKSTSSDTPHYENVPFEIPAGWVWSKLGDVGKWQAGATPSRSYKEYYGGNIPWLKTGDLNDDFIEHIPETITDKALNETSVKLNPAGSVLIAMYGATIGKIGILKFPATTNQACCACIEFNGILPLYLFYFLMANRPLFVEMGGGGAQPNISKEKIIDTFIPIPPIEEQKRIVVAIAQYFSKVTALECEQAALLKYINAAKSKILDLALSGRLTSHTSHYEKYPYLPLSEIFHITMGQSPESCHIKHFKVGLEFHQGKIYFGNRYLQDSGVYTDRKTKIAEAHSLLMCVRAPVGVINITERRICIGRGLCALKLKDPNMPIEYWYYALSSLSGHFEERSTGSTFKAITMDVIRNTLIRVPPTIEQEAIVCQLEQIDKIADKVLIVR